MENMIQRIVDMDRRAQDILATAQKEKLDAEDRIAEKAAALQKNYLDQARRRIQISAENDRTLFEQRWTRRQKHYDRQMERLETRFAENHDNWLGAIVDAATKPAE